MHKTFLKLYMKFHNLTNSEDGQDMLEYALLLTMISLALILSISGLAAAVNRAFSNISSSLA
jgi:pilus assembly protein Flp/PilA